MIYFVPFVLCFRNVTAGVAHSPIESVSDVGDFTDVQQKFNLQFFEAQKDTKS